MLGIGIDGCRGGWLVVQFDGQSALVNLYQQLEEITTTISPDQPVWVDMPIGFTDRGPQGRSCDQLARKVLSPLRHSSVFTPPCRAAVYADKEDASTVNATFTTKKLSRQSINIIPKIRALDIFLLKLPIKHRLEWYEAHPEVVFAAFNQNQPVAYSKKDQLGRTARKQLLKPYFSNLALWYRAAAQAFPRKQVLPDDIIDALALAIASYLVQVGNAKLVSLPDPPPQDTESLLMRIVYAQPA